MRITSFILLSVIGLASLQVNAQDRHFSQFDKSPMYLNPGLAGLGKGFNRANANYRTQWGALNKAYSTMAFSIDMPILSSSMNVENAYIGVGLDFMSDKAGTGQLTSNQFGLTLSAMLLANTKNTLSLGFRTAFEQRVLKSDGSLSWDNQWNGLEYDPTLSSGENFGALSHSYFDFSTGFAWKYVEKNIGVSAFDKLTANAGIAYFHINKPDRTFYGFEGDEKYSKIVAHAMGTFGLRDQYITITPAVYFAHQGPYNMILAGSTFKYLFRSDTKYTGFLTEKAIGLGLFFRGKDAMIPSFLFEVAGIEFGVNYDYTISTLQKANNGVGAFEFSLRWLDTYGVLFKQGDKHVLFMD